MWINLPQKLAMPYLTPHLKPIDLMRYLQSSASAVKLDQRLKRLTVTFDGTHQEAQGQQPLDNSDAQPRFLNMSQRTVAPDVDHPR